MHSSEPLSIQRLLSGDAGRVILAKGLRAIGDGFVSILLPAYLLGLGHTPLLVGVLTTATLLGSAVLTLLTGTVTTRFGHRKPLLWAAGLMTATGLGFAGIDSFWPLLVIAFVGTINPSTGDVSVFLPLEQSLLSHSVPATERTRAFAYFSLAGSLMGALGTLGAAFPGYLAEAGGITPLTAMRAMFVFYAGLGVLTALLYRGVRAEAVTGATQEPQGALGPSKRNVYRLTVLFSADAFGGGFLVQSLIAVWLFRAFQLPVSTAAQIFFATNLLAAVSFLVAVPVAKRFGLVNTMVFTHLPSSLALFAIPFLSNLGWVIALLMVRSFLSQMDVPTRTSYVMSVVTPPERAAAASLTAVPRSLAATIGPVIAGYLLTVTTFAWPLLIGGGIKVAYDLALLAMFRSVRPEEEK